MDGKSTGFVYENLPRGPEIVKSLFLAVLGGADEGQASVSGMRKKLISFRFPLAYEHLPHSSRHDCVPRSALRTFSFLAITGLGPGGRFPCTARSRSENGIKSVSRSISRSSENSTEHNLFSDVKENAEHERASANKYLGW
jgi:hypothetical protein